jgi:inositol hexakisphosphate/diphosphoinositol-pentakisphosphate kinase
VYRPQEQNLNQGMELRSVVAVFRHGDRTPKQKMKMKVSHPIFIEFYNQHQTEKGKELKVKSIKLMEEL